VTIEAVSNFAECIHNKSVAGGGVKEEGPDDVMYNKPNTAGGDNA